MEALKRQPKTSEAHAALAEEMAELQALRSSQISYLQDSFDLMYQLGDLVDKQTKQLENPCN